MSSHGRRSHRITAALVALAAFACLPALAQQTSVVNGIAVNLGVVPAATALRADGHREAHASNPPPGSQHLLITLDDQKSGRRIGDAEVVIEVKDPHGHVEHKPMLHTQAGGLPDYSELFEFGWSGTYQIRVIITPAGQAKPLEAHFTLHHTI